MCKHSARYSKSDRLLPMLLNISIPSSEALSTSIPKSISNIDSSRFPDSPSAFIKIFVTSVLYPKSDLHHSWSASNA